VTVGDIHWVQLPTANGYEQRGRRPAIILQDDQYAGALPVVLVVPLTTTRAALRFAGTTLSRPAAENGLRQASVALVFQVRVIDRRRVQERIGSISEEVLHEVFAELDKLTGPPGRGVKCSLLTYPPTM
jgi:mRNA interferase MazF